MKAIDKKTLLQLDNMAILFKAAAAGMKIYPEDQFVNYAEIDHELGSREDEMVQDFEKEIENVLDPWLRNIETKEDLDPGDLDLSDLFKNSMLGMIRSVWMYGDKSAELELQKMDIAANSEIMFFAAVSGEPTSRDGTWNDAFEWYEQYAQQISSQAGDDLWQHMQPLILEHIEAGTVRTGLVAALLADFARVGVVRADIIARTESSKAYNWGRRYRFDQSPALAGYRYSAIMDRRTTPICKGLHGHSWEKGDPDLDSYTPPNHFRCRSVIVPISKYKDFKFDPAPDDFLESLGLTPAEITKAQKMLDKFKDTSFYPKAVMSKAAAVAAVPKAPAPGPTPAVAQPAQPPAPGPGVKEYAAQSEEAGIKYLQDLIDSNVKRGISPAHPTLKAWEDMIKEIQGGKYKGKAFTVEWNKKAANGILLREFAPHGNLFIHTKGKVPKAHMDRMMKELDVIKDDPLFSGIKVQLENYKSGSSLASYSASKDLMVYTPEARGIQTLYHEIGHRVHNVPALYDSTYFDLLQKNGINIDDQKWASWQKTVEKYWEAKRTSPGSELLPDDMVRRWDYPINAKFYYKKGTKQNFYKEMFAESSSVYLEADPAEIKKVQRTFPGLMEYMEGVYKRGVIK